MTVPVVVFAHDRPERLAQALACLRENGVATLEVFVDGPRPGAEHRHAQVRDLLEGLDWTEPRVVLRPKNLGVTGSLRAGLDDVFGRHDRAIVIEDDVLVAPSFCAFASRCLDVYAADACIAGVTGLRYPFPRLAFAGSRWDVFFSPRFSSWGWATWARFWERAELDPTALRERVAATPVRPADAGADLVTMVDAYLGGDLHDAWDVGCAITMLLERQLFVCPRWNLVVNSGLTGGTHFSKPPPWTLAWEQPPRRFPERARLPPAARRDEHVLRAHRQFFAAPPRPSRLRRRRGA